MKQIRITPEWKADLYNLLHRLADNMVPFEYIYDVNHNLYIKYEHHCNAARQVIKEHAINVKIYAI